MGMVSEKTDLIFGAIAYFLENKYTVKFAYRDLDGIAFETERGDLGSVVRSKDNKNWEIKVGKDVVYTLEPQVFSIISNSETAPDLNEYIKTLQKIKKTRMKKKSRSFVSGLINSIGSLCLNGYTKNHVPITVGPFFVYYRKTGERITVILN
jgi:hypothetical protein